MFDLQYEYDFSIYNLYVHMIHICSIHSKKALQLAQLEELAEVGEYTAAVVAGTMSLEDGLKLVARPSSKFRCLVSLVGCGEVMLPFVKLLVVVWLVMVWILVPCFD